MLESIHFSDEVTFGRVRGPEMSSRYSRNEEAQIMVTDGITRFGVSDLRSTKG